MLLQTLPDANSPGEASRSIKKTENRMAGTAQQLEFFSLRIWLHLMYAKAQPGHPIVERLLKASSDGAGIIRQRGLLQQTI
jgi:hypothetical protein